MPVRAVLIEDNDSFRTSLELLFGLSGEVEVVGSSGDGRRAVDLCREHDPAVAVLDYRLPGTDGVQLAREHGAMPDVVERTYRAMIAAFIAAEQREHQEIWKSS